MSVRELLRCTLYVIITSSVVFVTVTVPCLLRLLQTCSTNSWTLEECHGHSDHGVSENTKTVDREAESMSIFVAHSTIVMRIVGRLQLPLKSIYASTRDFVAVEPARGLVFFITETFPLFALRCFERIL